MITVNIGLNNNTMTYEDVKYYFEKKSPYKLINHKLYTGEYNNLPEPTFVGNLTTPYARYSKIINDFENICSVMNQECIAISCKGMDTMVFNPNYSGEKFKFNKNFFEEI